MQISQTQQTRKYTRLQSCLLICVLACLFLSLLPAKVSAEGISLRISPANFQIRSTVPADIRAPFTLTNRSNDPLDLKIIVKRFKQSTEENGQLVFEKATLLDERPQDSFLENVLVLDDGFAISTVTLSPKQEKKLEISITTDKSLPPSDHYFSLVFLTVTKNNLSGETDEKETKSYVQTGINLPVLISLASDEGQVGFIDEFSSPFFLESGPVPFKVKIKNSGRHFITPKGVILIKNLFGQTVGKIDLPTTSVLAGTSRLLTDAKSTPITAKKFAEDTTPKAYWSDKFLVGFYTATLTVSMNNSDTLYTRSVFFAAFPFSALLILFALSYLAFIIIKRLRRKLAEE